MPFKKGNKIGPRFNSKNQPPSESKTHGRQRCHVARQVLSLRVKLDPKNEAELRESFPEIGKHLTGEELATLVQLRKAIASKDTQAYKALLDSAYGSQSCNNQDGDEESQVPLSTPFLILEPGNSEPISLDIGGSTEDE